MKRAEGLDHVRRHGLPGIYAVGDGVVGAPPVCKPYKLRGRSGRELRESLSESVAVSDGEMKLGGVIEVDAEADCGRMQHEERSRACLMSMYLRVCLVVEAVEGLSEVVR